MSKKASKLPLFVFFILVLYSLSAIALFNFFDTEDYVIANVLEVSGTTVVLGNNCTVIISQTSPERAYAIETGLMDIIDERPNTYDVFADTLRNFNITLDYVTLDKYEDGIYYANMYLSSKEKVLMIDLKPSDGIALALRTGSDIYINKTLLEMIGSKIC